MVFTGAYATFQWTKEAVFNVVAACLTTSYPATSECPGPFSGEGSVPFGFEQKLTNWTFTNNAIPLQRLNDVRLNAFAYGQTQGTISLDFVLANPWWLDMVGFGASCTTGCAEPYTTTWTIGSCAASKTIESMSIEIGQEQGATDQTRTLTGGIVNSASLSTSIGETAKMSLDISYSQETLATGACVLDTTPALQSICDYIPYTFAHGSLYFGAETCACIPDVCNLLAEVQDLDMTINQNGELLWGLGNSVAQSAYRKVFEVSGRAKLSHINTCKLLEIYQQSKDTLCNTCPAQTLSTEAPGLQLVFDNGVGTEAAPVAGTRLIKINIKNISVKDINIPIEPNEPIFEEINFQGREMDAKAITGTDQAGPPVAT